MRHVCSVVFLAFLFLSYSALAQTTATSSSTPTAGKGTTKSDNTKKQAKPATPKQPKANTDQAQPEAAKYLVEIVTLPAPKTATAVPAAAEIIKLLGSPKPFSFAARGSSTILIYSSTAASSKDDTDLLNGLKAQIQQLAGVQYRVYEVALPPGVVPGELAEKATSLKYEDISVEAAGPDKVRIRSAASANAPTLAKFMRELQRLAWPARPELPASRVFYLQAEEAASAIATATSAKSDTKTGSGQSQDSAKPSTPVQTAQSNTAPAAADKSTAAGNAQTAGTDKPDPSASDKQKADTNSGNASPESKTASAAASDVAVGGDMLLFAKDQNDAAIVAKKRMLASIDFPRPEVILNVWSFQSSSSSPKTLVEAAEKLRWYVGEFNQALQLATGRAWIYLRQQAAQEDYFDAAFYNYLTQRYVADSPGAADLAAGRLDLRSLGGQAVLGAAQRTDAGICGSQKYCLGYTTLFRPIQPTLTHMLLAVIAAKEPGAQMAETIRRMRDPDTRSRDSGIVCDKQDREALKDWLSKDFRSGDSRFPMYCFEDVAGMMFPKNDSGYVPILRATVANFLFNYKLQQQYPREFPVYDLGQSAQAFDDQLNPLTEAFNRDLAAFLDVVSSRASGEADANGWFGPAGHGTRFINNGVIKVRTLSGKRTIIDTTTQNFFDATNPPSATDLIEAVGNAEKSVPGVLKTNLTANEAAVIIGALNSVNPTQAKVGRQFKIDITPRSLNGASSAELEIAINSQDVGEPTLYSKGKSEADNLSRVAQHTTQTKVRLQSIKLFEVSSFTARLQRSRRNFPLVPPFLDIPYVGSFISVPLPGAKEYHRSTAVMSAIVVPTAADLATSMAFVGDRIAVALGSAEPGAGSCDAGSSGGCALRRAVSMSDVSTRSIRDYNRAMVNCLATGSGSCGRLSLSSMLADMP